MDDRDLLAFFGTLNVPYVLHNHRAIFSAKDECEEMKAIPGAHSKNLFLKDKKGRFALVSVLEHKRVDLKTLSDQLGYGRFSFGNPDELKKYLRVAPGSVTPYGLVNDVTQAVKYYLDKDFTDFDNVNFHPLRNDQTITMSGDGFMKFLLTVGHPPQVIEIPCLDQHAAPALKLVPRE